MTQPPDPNPAPFGGPPSGAPRPQLAPPGQPHFAPPGQPVPANPAVPSFGPAPTGWAPTPAGTAANPVIAGARPGRTPGRGGRAGVLAALLTGIFGLVVGNQWVLGWLTENVRQTQLRAPIFSLFYAHWTATPLSGRGDGFSDILTHGFWTDANGGIILQRLSVGDDEVVHWLFNFVRLGMLVVAVGIAVAIALSRHGGGVLARALSAWGAMAVAAGIVGGLTTAAFSLVTDSSPLPLTAELLAGAAFGAQWALVVGWLIALPAALAAR